MSELTCPEDGTVFTPKTPNQTYCSPKCAKRAERRRYKQRKRQTEQVSKAVAKVPGGRSQYPPEVVEIGLEALVWAGGSPKRASESLKELGYEIKPDTLRAWKRDRPERYEALRADLEPRMKAARAEAHEALADQFADAARAALADLNKLREQDQLTPQQLISLMHNASVDAGIHRDKAAKLRGENVMVIEHRSDKEIIDKLKRMGVIIEGEAREVRSVQPSREP